VVLVLNGLDSNAVKQKYTWGLDLSGLSGDGSTSGIHGAGGIGGLLAAVETGGANQGSYWYFYDGNGNVGQVLNATDTQSITVAARYEYDPYGHQLASTGDYASANPFRFSTKWFDTEVDYPNTSNDGLYYYGFRYYLPRLGRWGSRDPVEEAGGDNLYVLVGNHPINTVDSMGLSDISPLPGGQLIPPSCCNGKKYDSGTQCCEDGAVVNKTSIWICKRPIADPGRWYAWWPWWWLGIIKHCYVCCDGVNQNCYSKGPHNEAAGPIDPEGMVTADPADCEVWKVCPKVKQAKCNNPSTDTPYGAITSNCCDWAYQDVIVKAF
jgi:RHS repeat-associated protein